MTTGEHKKIAGLSNQDRLVAAKAKITRVVDHALYVLELHVNNAIVLMSPLLSSQIPTSFAANAFRVFQHGLHQIEIVRLCALWDSVDLMKENIPTIVALIDHPDVLDALAQETAAPWTGSAGGLLNPSSDPELHAIELEAIHQANADFGQQQSQRARNELGQAIAACHAIVASPRHASIMNTRDKHLAHSLTQTRREKSGRPIVPMKYGDERDLLNETLPIVQALYCWVGGTGFDFENSRDIDRENAKALWEACAFTIEH